MALAGLAAFVDTLRVVRERLNPALAAEAVLLCRVDQRTRLAQDVLAEARRRYRGAVLATVIRSSVRLAEAPSWHQDIAAYAPDSPGDADYQAAARELTQQWARRAQKSR